MAWDFTLSGGNKTEKTSRTRSSVKQASGATLTQSVASEAKSVGAYTGANPLEDMGAGLSSFFGGVVEQERIDNEEMEKRRNEDAIIEANRRVLADPKGAAEARRTGDHSAFVPDDELRGRKVVMDAYWGTQGASAALEDYESTGRDFINKLPSTANPIQAYQEYMAERVENTHKNYQESFMRASGALSQPDITKFQNARQKMVIGQARRAGNNVLAANWRDEGDNPSANFDPEGDSIRAYSSIPVPTSMSDQWRREDLAQTALDAAAKGNQAAIEYLNVTRVDPGDPNSPTLAVALGHGLTQAITAQALKERNEVTTTQNYQLETVMEGLATGDVSPSAALNQAKALRKQGVHGLNPSLLKISATAQKLLKASAKATATMMMTDRVANVLASKLPLTSFSAEEHNDVVNILESVNYSAAGFAQQYGIPEAQAQKRIYNLMGMGYISDKQKKKNAQLIYTPDVPIADRTKHMEFLVNYPGNLEAILPDGEAGNIVPLIHLWRDNPELGRKALKGLTDAVAGGLDPQGVWHHPGAPKDADTKEKFQTKMVKGMSSDTWARMTPALKARMLASASMLVTGLGDPGMAATIEEYSAKNMSASYDVDGSLQFVPDNPLGDNFKQAELVAMSKAVEEAYPSLQVSGVSGLGGGAIIHGAEWQPGDTPQGVLFTSEEAAKNLPDKYRGFVKTVNDNGSVTFSVPPEPKAGDSFVRAVDGSKDLFMVFENGTWTLRYSDNKDLSVVPSKVPRGATAATQALFIKNKEIKGLQRTLEVLQERNARAPEAKDDATGPEKFKQGHVDQQKRANQKKIDDIKKKLAKLNETPASIKAGEAKDLADKKRRGGRAGWTVPDKDAWEKNKGMTAKAAEAAKLDALLDAAEAEKEVLETPVDDSKGWDQTQAELARHTTDAKALSNQSGVNATLKKLIADLTAENGPDPFLQSKYNYLSQDNTDPAVDTPEDVPDYFMDLVTEAREKELLRDNSSTDGAATTFEALGRPFIVASEGLSLKAYDDGDGRSIGYGYNFTDPATMAVLATLGHTAESLEKKGMTETEAKEALPAIWIMKQQQAVKVLGETVWSRLSDKQRTAMTSLSYNALSLLGDGLVGALDLFTYSKTRKDAEGARGVDDALAYINYEIRYNSLPFAKMIREGNMKYIDGLIKRRNKEADMAMGDFLNDENDEAKYSWRVIDWRKQYADVIKKSKKANKGK